MHHTMKLRRILTQIHTHIHTYLKLNTAYKYSRSLFLFLPFEAVKSIATVKLIWVLQKKQIQILLIVLLLCRKINKRITWFVDKL